MSSEEHFISDTPVAIAIESLQKQVHQLKSIIQDSNNNNEQTATSTENGQDLQQRVKQLEIANAKAEYRIKMLLRALEERDAKQ
ncbi:hypothetical protein K501DRAFT_259603 [Backusella circina FSU 941]|nr:hypothetical protein K501DRAFT_259603 [Backusella circina FSU 941]